MRGSVFQDTGDNRTTSAIAAAGRDCGHIATTEISKVHVSLNEGLYKE